MILDREQAPLDQIRLNRATQADCDIGLPHRQIQLVRGQDQLDAHLRIEIEKLSDALCKPDAANSNSGRDLEFASGFLAGFGQALTHALKAPIHVLSCLEEHLTVLCEDEASGM